MILHIAWSYPSLSPTARFCLAMAQAKSSWLHHHAGSLSAGHEACELLCKAKGRPPEMFGGFCMATLWLLRQAHPRLDRCLQPTLFSMCWHHAGLVMGGCLQPAVQVVFGGSLLPLHVGLFGKWSWWVVPSMPGILFNTGMLIAHTSGLMRKGESPRLQVQLWIPLLQGQLWQQVVLCISVKKPP